MNDSTVPIHPPTPKYRSYLLRLWHVELSDCWSWHASLEDPRTAARIGFASLEQLFAFLIEQAEDDAKGKREE